MSGVTGRRSSAGTSQTRRLINNALRSLGVTHDGRFNAGITELQRAELALYGGVSTSEDVLYRWQQVLIATEIKERDRDNPLNRSRKYLKAGIHALERGDLLAARGYFRSVGMEQAKAGRHAE